MLDRGTTQEPIWLDTEDCDIDAFRRHVDRKTVAGDYPLAQDITGNIPVYNAAAVLNAGRRDAVVRAHMTEWSRAFLDGPGIIAIRGGYRDLGLIDAVTREFDALIAEEKAAGTAKGDHFASAGANSRIWNAHEKLCMRAPDLFMRYNANPILRMVSECWLGPKYQITTQVNVVRPGGAAQTVHRDYHMGMNSQAELLDTPAAQHRLSAHLTLQGAVAHSDMPVVSGPTKLLPYSHSFLPGYLAVLRPEFRACFEEHCVQLPLEKGDLLFFNPAVFHAAGQNRTTDVQRYANLMQIGSAYGRSIEIVDRARMVKALYPTLAAQDALTDAEIDNVVAATAEGYAFPANLDIDQPLSGMVPPSQQDILRQALAEDWTSARLSDEIDAQMGRKRSH